MSVNFYKFSPYLEKVKLFKSYNDLLEEFINTTPNDFMGDTISVSGMISTSKKQFVFSEAKRYLLEDSFGHEIYDYIDAASELVSYSDDNKIELFFKLLYSKCLIEYYKQGDVELFNFNAIPSEDIDEIVDVLKSISGAFSISEDEIPITMVDKYPDRVFTSSFDWSQHTLLRRIIKVECDLKKFLDAFFEINGLHRVQNRIYDFIGGDKELLNKFLNFDMSQYGTNGMNLMEAIIKQCVLKRNEDFKTCRFNLGPLTPDASMRLRFHLKSILDDKYRFDLHDSAAFYKDYLEELATL